MKTLANVKGLGKVVELIGAFDKRLQELRREAKKRGLELKTPVITPRDEAYARIQTKNAKQIGRSCGTWTSAGFEYMHGEEAPILRKHSRLLNPELAKKAVEANIGNRYFFTDSTKEYEQDRKIADKEEKQGKAPNERSVIVLPSRDNFNITPKENWHVAEFLFEEQAEPYFVLHENHCGSGVPITTHLVRKNTVDTQGWILMTQLWFGGLGLTSELDGCKYLDYANRAHAVFEKTSKAGSRPRKTSPKIKPPYTQRQLNTQVRRVERIKSRQVKLSDLESEVTELAKFLEKLRNN